MEKLAYLLFDEGDRPGGELRDALRDKAVPALREAGARDITLHVQDEHVAAGAAMRKSDPPIRAMVSFWLGDSDDRGACEQALAGHARRIAGYLDIPIDEAKWDAILDHCSFAYMKAHASDSVPLRGAFWEGGAETFVHKGLNGRWRDTLSAEASAAYEERAQAELGPECAAWLLTGDLP